MAKKTSIEKSGGSALINDLAKLIEQSRQQVAVAVNSTLTILFWQVGKCINDHILLNKRAEYGKEIVSTVATQLAEKYGRNFAVKNLHRMMQFTEQYTDINIVVTLSRHLSWSHFLVLIPLKTKEAKEFYAQETIQQTLSVRELRQFRILHKKNSPVLVQYP